MNLRTRITNLERAEKAYREKLTREQANDPALFAAIMQAGREDSEFCKTCLDAAALDCWLHQRQEQHIAKATGRPLPQGLGPDPDPRPVPTIPKMDQ